MSDFVPEPDPNETESTFIDPVMAEPPHPINWNLLTAEDAEVEWLELNRWVNWLRKTYGLPASVIPPAWFNHPELVWELSALHLHWLCAYDPEQDGSAPLGWHRDFADARERLRDWVATSGTRLDRDAEFVDFIMADVASRREAEDAFYANAASDSGEMS
ncbi:hypothetical protein G7067_05635 [Leucobacter insecticola]|uniref:DUF4913 domain-containing protein n=1 Tax=Leucobacter insecticola TaxID=2714934 RepID=A0A6G8FI23_9MICO|nr:hypothetical protein [Leucobacter insecticola]QIM16014.1 hypothetical protein G7067_05635 [Leucobacter insecticola]